MVVVVVVVVVAGAVITDNAGWVTAVKSAIVAESVEAALVETTLTVVGAEVGVVLRWVDDHVVVVAVVSEGGVDADDKEVRTKPASDVVLVDFVD